MTMTFSNGKWAKEGAVLPLLGWYTASRKTKTLTVCKGFGNLHSGTVHTVLGIRDARKLCKTLGAKPYNF